MVDHLGADPRWRAVVEDVSATPPSPLSLVLRDLRSRLDRWCLRGLGLIVLVLGIPAAIILTILYGMWWTFFPAVGLTMAIWVLGYVAEVREKRLEDSVS